MTEAGTPQVTQLLHAAASGDRVAAERLLPLVYDELRALARARLSRIPPGATLQPTALVHEAYMKVVGKADPGWDGRGHFFAAAARAMRNILVDQARRKAAVKHGGAVAREHITPDLLPIDQPAENMIALDEALRRLEADDPRKAQVVMLRFFTGLTSEETAQVLGVSLPTVERDWRFARSWLARELGGEASP